MAIVVNLHLQFVLSCFCSLHLSVVLKMSKEVFGYDTIFIFFCFLSFIFYFRVSIWKLSCTIVSEIECESDLLSGLEIVSQ